MLEKQPTSNQETSITISPEVMKKGLTELVVERDSFEKTIKGLKAYETEAKNGNPVSLTDFKQNRAKIVAFETMLKEVEAAIKVKEAEEAFDEALRGTGEMAEADRLDRRRMA